MSLTNPLSTDMRVVRGAAGDQNLVFKSAVITALNYLYDIEDELHTTNALLREGNLQGYTLHTTPAGTATAATREITLTGLRSHHLIFVETLTKGTASNKGKIKNVAYTRDDVATVTYTASVNQTGEVLNVLVVDPGMAQYGVFGRTAAGATTGTALACIMPGLKSDDYLLGTVEVAGTAVNQSVIGKFDNNSNVGRVGFASLNYTSLVVAMGGFRNYGDRLICAHYTMPAGAATSWTIPVPGMTADHAAFLAFENEDTGTSLQANLLQVVAGDGVVTLTSASDNPDGAIATIVGVKLD